MFHVFTHCQQNRGKQRTTVCVSFQTVLRKHIRLANGPGLQHVDGHGSMVTYPLAVQCVDYQVECAIHIMSHASSSHTVIAM